MRRVAGFVWDHPVTALALFVGLVGLAVAGTTRLRVDFAPASFYASDDQAATTLQSFTERWGPDDNVLMVVVGAPDGDLLTEARVAAIGRLADALRSVEGVRRVTSIATIRVRPPDQPTAEPGPLWTLPAFGEPGPVSRADVLSAMPFVPLLLSTDARVSALAVELDVVSNDPTVVVPVVERVERMLAGVDAGPIRVHGIAGAPAIHASFVRLTIGDQRVLLPASLGFVALALFWIFRRAHGVLIPMAAAVVPLVLLLGVMGWTGEPIGLLSQAYFTLVPILALADGVHLLARYHEERRSLPPRAALLAAVEHAGLACTLTTATTVVAFLSIGIGGPPMLVRFGVFAAIGLLLAYATVFVVLPLGLRVPHARPPAPGRQRLLGTAGRLAVTRPSAVVLVAAAVAGVFGIGARWTTVDNRLSGLLRADHPVRQAGMMVDRQLGGIHSIEIDLEGPEGAFAEQRVVNASATFEDWAMTLPGVRAVIGPGRSLEAMARATARVLDSPDAIEATWTALGDETDIARMVTTDRGGARISVRAAEIGGAAIDALADDIRTEAVLTFTPHRVRVTVTGTTVVASRGVNAIGRAIEWSLLLQLGVIAVMFAVVLRSRRMAFLALVPNVLPVLVGYGLLGWLGIDLDPLAGTILAFGVGIAVDNTIHVVLRIREHLRQGDALPAAIEVAVTRSGRAVAITTIVIGTGLALNLLSSFPPLELLGALGAVLMFTALVGDLVLLPALLVLAGRVERAGRTSRGHN